MEFITFIVIILVVGAIFGLPIAALVVSRSNARRLREEIYDLRDELRNLEANVKQMARERSEAVAAASAPVTASALPVAVVEPPKPAVENKLAEPVQPAVPAEPLRQAAESKPAPPAAAAFRAPAQPASEPRPVIPGSQPAPAPPAPPTAAPHEPSFAPVPVLESAQVSEEPSRREKAFSLEERLGTNWLNKIGIAILVVGLAFFLAVKLQTMGPAGKVLCGFAVSAALLAGGVWLERKATYRIFARAGIGGGWALAFFTTFAMHHIDAARVLDSLVADLVLMLLVAAGMVAHSLRYRSQTVTGLAFLLGYVTLLTSHMQAESGTVVFSLWASAILALALVAVTTRRHYAVLEILGLCAVYATHFVWLTQVMPEDRRLFTEFWPSTLLIFLYWLIFRLAYVLRTPLDQAEENLSSLAAVLNSGGVLGLLKYQSAHPEWAFRVLAALGAIEMCLAFFVRGKRRQAFVVLSTIATVLLIAAVPFRFHGVSWPVLWLVEAQALAICGLRLGEPVFRRLGLLAGVVTGAVIAIVDIGPLALMRLDYPDPSRHASLTAALALAAILYWMHGEFYPRRWPEIAANDMETVALQVTSWLGAAAAATALWVVLPEAWVVVGWLALMVALGVVADRLQALSLSVQADALAASAVLGLFVWNLWSGTGWGDHKLPLACAVALLYAGMRRKMVQEGMPNYVAPVYSWLATLLLAFVALDQAAPVAVGPAWAVIGVMLFEIGRSARRGFLRWQGFLLVALGYGRYLYADLADSFGNFAAIRQRHPAGQFSLTNSLLLEVLVLAAAGYWLAERTRDAERHGDQEQVAGLITGGLSTFAIAVWFAFRFPSDWVPVAGGELWVAAVWAAMATAFLGLAWILRRRALLVQSIALALAAATRGVFFDLFENSEGRLWHGPLFHVSVSALILFAALPFAFQLRRQAATEVNQFEQATGFVTGYPEQWFFFTPFALMVIALAMKLSSAHITIAWSILGVAVFLFALVVGERSYRLAGLGLLLVSVVKILLMDVWALAPADRYTTLIVLGLALLAVSFLYTRFGTVIRKYL